MIDYIADDKDFNLSTSEIIEYKSHIRVNVDREGELSFVMKIHI